MPNLVGIGNSQVPTNAMLGGLAYQDSVGEINLEKIKARTDDTAVDIFVYDTRKDSDGGAWRKRATTQSWYNEGASKTRGARKEFPAVAIIVIETYELVIYDGDDPNLPMWMRFEMNQLESPIANMGKIPFGLGHTNAHPHNNLNLSCVHMLNGYLFIGANRDANTNQLQAGYDVNFVSEIMHEYLHYPTSAAHVSKWRLAGKLIDRNRTDLSDSPTSRYGTGSVTSFKDMANDVDMVVLPNAPIDPFSGLPVPTVALATEGGASIIMDDGNTYSTNDTLSWSRVNISEANGGRKVLNYIFSIGGTVRHKFIDNISADFDRDYEDYPHPTASTSVTSNGNSDVYGHSTGMMIYKRGNDPGSHNNADYDDSKAFVSYNFNSGYMQGDNKGAYLSDTTAETMSESGYTNLLTNGSDWTGASGTTAPNGWTSFGYDQSAFTIDSGRLKIGNGSNNAYTAMHQNVTTVVGTTYTLYFNYQLHSSAQYLIFRVGTATLNGSLGYFYGTSTSDVQSTITFVATGTSTNISVQLQATSGNAYGWVDTMYVKAIGAADRFVTAHDSLASSSANGLAVKGTVTKTPVATGAELVAYSGFSGSNYLLQPYTADLEFTDSMSIMLWVKGWVGSDSLLHRGPGTTRNSKTSFHLYCSYDHNYRITFTTNGSTEQTFEITLDGSFLNSSWQHLCFSLSTGTVRGFLNGQEKTLSSNSFTGNIFSQSTDRNGLWVGTGPVGGAADTASIALLRFSSTAPSARQVKKIYDDEKCLFHEDAKCTLYGTSDDVNAIAYDDSNDTLHVGTSSGRSDFRGLNRINNTTTAVTTAISASDGLVAEQ